MIKIPRIALFRPHDEDVAFVSSAFQRHEYSTRTVDNTDQILESMQEEQAEFDCIVIPPRTNAGSSGVNLVLQVKTCSPITAVPVLALCQSKDRSLIESLFGAGVDVLLSAPLDADCVYYQVAALARQRRALSEQLSRHFEDTGMRQSLIGAFNSIREGIAICDHEFDLTFVNSSGATLLGIKPSHTLEQVRKAVEQFVPFLRKHEELHPSSSRTSQAGTDVSTFNPLVSRLDGRTFKAEVRVTALRGSERQLVGYSLSLTDLSGILQLSQLLVQAQRTRSLALLTGAGCSHLFGAGPIHAPLQQIEHFLEQEAPSASLGDTMTYLLELLDVVIPPGIDVKIKAKGDWLVAFRRSDLFQLVGYITLLAVENAILGGEVILDVDPNQNRAVNFTVSSRAESRIRFLHDDLVSQIIEGSLTHIKHGQQNKVSQTFAAAQRIASRYRSTVVVDRASELEMKMSVDLPLASIA